MSWQECLRDAYKSRGFSQARLAREAGIAEDTLANWLRRRKPKGQPNIDDALAICRVLEMTLDQVFCGHNRAIEDRLVATVIRALNAERRRLRGDPPAGNDDTG